MDWQYLDENGKMQGPFPESKMRSWYSKGYLAKNLLVRRIGERKFTPLSSLGSNPFALKKPVKSSEVSAGKTTTTSKLTKTLRWFYLDERRKVQGPFSSGTMTKWYKKGYLIATLRVRCGVDGKWYLLNHLGDRPFDRDPLQEVNAKKARRLKRQLHYFYKDDNGEVQGPFPESKMKSWYRRGLLKDSLLVALPGEKFKPLTEMGSDPFGASRRSRSPSRRLSQEEINRMHKVNEPHPPLWHAAHRTSVPKSQELLKEIQEAQNTVFASHDRVAEHIVADADRIAKEKQRSKAEEDARIVREMEEDAKRVAKKKEEQDRVATEAAERNIVERAAKAARERDEKERLQRERLEREKKEKEEKDRLEMEKRERLENQRIEKEKWEKERLELEKREKEEKDRAKAKAEQEAADKAKAEAAAKEKREKEKKEKEKKEEKKEDENVLTTSDVVEIDYPYYPEGTFNHVTHFQHMYSKTNSNSDTTQVRSDHPKLFVPRRRKR